MITYDRLTPEQDRALEAPLDRPLVITGQVGSGRSTAALYRTLVRVASGRSGLIVVPDLLRKYRLIKMCGGRASQQMRVITLAELAGVLLPGSSPVARDDGDGWLQLIMSAVGRRVRTVSNGWAIVFDDAHDQPVRAVEFARLFDPALCVTVDPDVLVIGDDVGRRDVAEWTGRGWTAVELGPSRRLVPAAARLVGSLRSRPPVPTTRTDERPIVCVVEADLAVMAGLVSRLANADRSQRIAVVNFRHHLSAEISARLRRAVIESRYLPVFGGVTALPGPSSAGPVVQLSEARFMRGNEFDVVVVTGLHDRPDETSHERLADALARACGASRRAVYIVTERSTVPRLLSDRSGVESAIRVGTADEVFSGSSM